jgi:hypothetical protein
VGRRARGGALAEDARGGSRAVGESASGDGEASSEMTRRRNWTNALAERTKISATRAGVLVAKHFTANRILAVTTALNVIVSFLQWRAMRDSNEGAQRAWLIAKEIKSFNLAPGTGIAVSVIVENPGRSPATKVRSIRFAGLRARDEKFDPREQPLSKAQIQSGGLAVIGPGHSQAMPVTINPLTPEQIRKIRTGDTKLYLYGRIEYSDSFRNSRHTRFCFVWVSDDVIDYCATYNEAE